eukprot:TRINITY_DN43251_c0_g1_i1.p1 TRINITY_DN43251_c0_g1~~TRINITY_DN43251_c0_g1_i1.p1  ORF type:complete len:910 (+),score=179.78 TRINITY_DN43251_c0_g1_i1:128-2731(+)
MGVPELVQPLPGATQAKAAPRGAVSPASEAAAELARLRGPVSAKNIARISGPLRSFRAKLLPSEVARVLYFTARQPDSTQVRELLGALARHIASAAAAPKPDRNLGQVVASSLFGMRFRGDSVEARSLVAAVAALAGRCRQAMSARQCGMAMLGLQRQEGPPALAALLELAKLLRGVPELDAYGVANVLYSLHRRKASPETRAVLRAARPLADACAEPFTPTMAAMVLYGMQRQDPGECAALLSIVARQLAAAKSGTTDEQTTSMALYGLQRQPCGAPARQVLSALVSVLRGGGPLGPHAIGAALYGMQRQGGTPAARAALAALTPRIAACYVTLPSAQLTTALYGMQGLDDSGEVAVLTDELAALAERSAQPLSGQDAAAALYGLRRRRGSGPTRRLLAALAARLDGSATVLNSMQLGQALVGLCRQDAAAAEPFLRHIAAQGATRRAAFGEAAENDIGATLYGLHQQPPSESVNRVIATVAELARRCKQPLSERSIATALYGLQGKEDCASTRALLRVLGTLIAASPCRALSAQGVGNALYGMNTLGDSQEARGVYSALAPRVLRCAQPLQHQLGVALYGLHAQGTAGAVRAALAALACLAVNAPPALHALDLSNALFGLRGQDDCPAVRALLGVLDASVNALPDALPGLWSTKMVFGLVALADAGVPEAPALLDAVLRRSPQPGSGPEHASLRQAMHMAGRPVPDLAPLPPKHAPNWGELGVQQLLRRAGVLGMEFNVQHDSGFELDMLWRGRINIELDGIGIGYRAPGKQRLRVLRDELLRERFGVTVRRVIAAPRSLSGVIGDVAMHCEAAESTGPDGKAWKAAKRLAVRGWAHALHDAVSGRPELVVPLRMPKRAPEDLIG